LAAIPVDCVAPPRKSSPGLFPRYWPYTEPRQSAAEFRRKFYKELSPQMIEAGVTVVVMTHDERHLEELHLPGRRTKVASSIIVEHAELSIGKFAADNSR
jgi:hypothetical protein